MLIFEVVVTALAVVFIAGTVYFIKAFIKSGKTL